MNQNVLAIFAKQPVPGQVKTRLAHSLGDQAAASLYECFVDTVLHITQPVHAEQVIAFSPATPEARAWFSARTGEFDCRLWPQPEGDLGFKLRACVAELLPAPGGAMVIMGTDSPSLPTSLIQSAFDQLQSHDVVLGPARDGGYYLIGLREPAPELFEYIRWSSDQVLVQTMDRIQQLRLSVHLLPRWYDVDTLDDLRRLHAHLRGTAADWPPLDVPSPQLLSAVDHALEAFNRRGVDALPPEPPYS